MSKVVKSVGRAISKVVKGVVNTVKKVASSKLGKVILTAAAIYFGGAALAGGFSSSAAGGSFLSGMGTGVANAASSLGQAWTSVLNGNFSAAGNAVSSGFQGVNAAQTAGGLANGMTQAQMLATQNAGIEGATALTNQAAATAFPASVTPSATNLALTPAQAVTQPSNGIISGAWNAMGDRAKAATISATAQLVGGAAQGYGQQQQYERQLADAERLRAEQEGRYRRSVDEFLQSSQQQAAAQQQQPWMNPSAIPRYDPVAEARAIGERYAMPQPGLISSQLMTNNNFPVYNPRTFRG